VRLCTRALALALALCAVACASVTRPGSPATPTAPSPTEAARGPRVVPDVGRRLRFLRTSIEDGLSQSVVVCMLQDSRGFVWLGTQDGLNRYDGVEFRVYRHDPEDPDSLADSYIHALAEDTAGRLWVSTNKGLDRLDRVTGDFIHHRHDPDDPDSLGSDLVSSLLVDRAGRLWVGTVYGGLNRLDAETGGFVHYRHDPNDPRSLSSDIVSELFEDHAGLLWVGTAEGLDRLDPETGRVTRFAHDADDAGSLSEGDIPAIWEDRHGVLWVGTSNGLNAYSPATGRFTRYPGDPDDVNGPGDSAVQSIYEDRYGTLWVGTHAGGLARLDPRTGTFVHHRNDPSDPESLSVNNVYSIMEDAGGVLWIGTFGGGVNRADRYRQKFTTYRANPANPDGLSHNLVWGFHEDSGGAIWIGTIGGGLNRLDRSNGQFRQFRHDPDNPDSISSDNVWSIVDGGGGAMWVGTDAGLDRCDRRTTRCTHTPLPSAPLVMERGADDTLWIGTSSDGLLKFDLLTLSYVAYENDPENPDTIGSGGVMALHNEPDGTLWAGTMAGLNRMAPGAETFQHYRYDPDDPTSLGHNTVLAIADDGAGGLWLGTFGGLDHFDRETETFTHYRESDGLPSSVIYGMLEDDEGCLWLSTNQGLSRFDPDAGTFRNYTVQDGLQGNEFNQSSFLRASDGEMFFGGVNGFSSFHPHRVADNPYIPPVVITRFTLFNETVKPGAGSPLSQPIEDTESIALAYTHDFFSFEFAALHYADPEQNRYAYMMEGLDKDWIDAGARQYAGYTSVPPGDYTFRVRGTNSDGVWNEQGTSLRITITPPFWQTWWFRLAAAVSVAAIVAGGVALRVRGIEARRRELEREVAERTRQLRETMAELERSKEAAERARQAAEGANRAKSVFLANMSHELRTPLNAILGFTQLIRRDPTLSADHQENLDIVARSSDHLLGLINDVLDVSKIEAGRTTLKTGRFDLHAMLDGLAEMFRLRAAEKGLRLWCERGPHVPRFVEGDEGKLRQVLMNLLGNAVKFTEHGRIALRVTVGDRKEPEIPLGPNGGPPGWRLWFEVEDTGPGIAPEALEAIFEPFVQASSGGDPQEGTGLGLSISREFVRLMGGELTVQSEVGRGSTFRFDIGVDPASNLDGTRGEPAPRVIGLAPGQPIYRLLVVDDKMANRRLLVKLLEPLGFEVREASDGQQALNVWETWGPHLIWMDMRMPVMDGYEATRRIKATLKGQATVIIAVTASALEEDRELILSEGCDGYVRKPFREEEIFDVLERHLGVRLRAEAEWLGASGGESETGEAAVSESRLDDAEEALAVRLAALPPAAETGLERAATVGDLDQIRASVDAISELDAELGARLAGLAGQFAHDAILRITQQTRVLRNG